MRSWTWPSADPTRRGATAGLAAALAALLSGCISTREADVFPTSRLAIDMSGLRASGLGDYADTAGAELARAAADVFVPGPGPRVTLAIARLQWGGEPAGDEFDGSRPLDFAQGHVEIVDARGVRRIPLLVSRPRNDDRFWTPEGERRRLFEIMQVFVRWAKAEALRAS
jgi:hypothetical protein